MSFPLLGLKLRIGKCSPELVKNVVDYVESKFWEFYSSTQFLSTHKSTVNFKGRSSRLHTPRPPPKLCAVPPFLSSEVRLAAEGVRRGKAPGADGTTQVFRLPTLYSARLTLLAISPRRRGPRRLALLTYCPPLQEG